MLPLGSKDIWLTGQGVAQDTGFRTLAPPATKVGDSIEEVYRNVVVR